VGDWWPPTHCKARRKETQDGEKDSARQRSEKGLRGGEGEQ
jgi:hypothetical protein